MILTILLPLSRKIMKHGFYCIYIYIYIYIRADVSQDKTIIWIKEEIMMCKIMGVFECQMLSTVIMTFSFGYFDVLSVCDALFIVYDTWVCCIGFYLSISLSLSLSIYIYIYIYISGAEMGLVLLVPSMTNNSVNVIQNGLKIIH